MARKSLDIIVVPSDGNAIRRFRLPVFSAYILSITATGFLGLIMCAVGIYWNAHQVHKKYTLVAQENTVLNSDLEIFQKSLTDLECRLDTTIEMENKARLLAGLNPLDDETRQLGIGGPDLAYRHKGVDKELGNQLAGVSQRLAALDRHLSFQEQSYDLILSELRIRTEELDHIPTINPVVGEFYLSSGFGRRPDPFTGRMSMHEGFDFCAAHGTPFQAAARGRVIFAGRSGDFGKVIKIDHGNGIVTIFGHADKILVKLNDEVERGQIIGHIGATGRTTGPHLHYEIQKNGCPVNPAKYLLDEERIVD
ncbi:MAG: M23 family metallopeptidase [Candidatus Eisenbacteria bacterium]|uniref:M23 family metallopeptidase n=1 Tax=Eiseniibacteriota bacterium TaxID=2212470 RepID=A0A948RYC2_UNCEI|nr:M23 family metallopeptidase [Candidatus Eisenbacteria bacterium]MBU1947293.1 M23 family metallopeptidase [Candidatus Eisenbacteria bacterium]MBU2691832.1 M23 family metallopeptidase [Candidatus Eisenbacteria bacterium]